MIPGLVISIFGPSGSGKSETAKALVAQLGDEHSVRVPTDYYVIPASGSRDFYLRQPLQYDWPLLAQALSVSPGTAVETPNFDFETFRRIASGGRSFIVRPIQIVDAMYPCPFADIRVWLDVPDSVRFARVVARDQVWGTRVAQRWEHLEISRRYSESREEHYDLCLSGAGPVESHVDQIAQFVAAFYER